MADDLQNLTELIEELEGLSIKTSQGSFLKMEDVRRLIDKRKAANAVDAAEAPKPGSLAEARGLAKEYLAKAGVGAKGPQEPGRAVPATDPQSSSRT